MLFSGKAQDNTKRCGPFERSHVCYTPLRMLPAQQSEDGPLSPEQTRQLLAADAQQRRILFATKVATFNGYALAGCAALCVLSAIFSPWAVLVAAGLAAAAYFELRGRNELRALRPEGARVLAINQVAVLAGVYVYCVVSLIVALQGPPLSEQLQQEPALASALDMVADPAVQDMVGQMDELARTLTVVLYVAVMGVSTLVQGAMAYYYLTRRRQLIAYLASTPGWILALQRQRT